MTEERKSKIKEIRQKLSNLSEEQKQSLTANGLILTVGGRTLSLYNTLLICLQSAIGKLPTVVGGYQQWRTTGKQVRKGEHGFIIWFPVGPKDEDGDIEAERFFTGTVFDISQVEDIE